MPLPLLREFEPALHREARLMVDDDQLRPVVDLSDIVQSQWSLPFRARRKARPGRAKSETTVSRPPPLRPAGRHRVDRHKTDLGRPAR